MPFKDLPEGQTHYYGDGCGCKEHNPITLKQVEKEFDKRYEKFCEAYGVMFTMTSTAGSLEDGIKQFYRQKIAEIIEAGIGEDKAPMSNNYPWRNGYNSAKAEIRQRFKEIMD